MHVATSSTLSLHALIANIKSTDSTTQLPCHHMPQHLQGTCGQTTPAPLAIMQYLEACESFGMPAAEKRQIAAWLASESALEAVAAAAAHSWESAALLQGTSIPASVLHQVAVGTV